MIAKVSPGFLRGEIPAIPSKSDAHRLMICAALGNQPTRLELGFLSKDMEATLDCLEALGAGIDRDAEGITITPITNPPENPLLDCQESGSTFRFLLPVACALCEKVSFTGSGRLPSRPIGDLAEAMKANGVEFSADALPFTCTGRLKAGEYELPGNVSSQYITGLLLALPKVAGKSRIRLTSKLESAAYVDITLWALTRFGIQIDREGEDFLVTGTQEFRSPGKVAVEGDWSNAAFFLCAGALGEPVTVLGLDRNSPQGDKQILKILEQFGAILAFRDNAITVNPGPLKGCTIDINPVPDLLPILSIVAAFAEGTTRFVNGARLRLKESDRLQAAAAMIESLGGQCREQEDSLIVTGKPLQGGTVDSFHDHRMVMSAAIAATRCSEPVIIQDAGAADKSYPTFFEDFKSIGGNADVI